MCIVKIQPSNTPKLVYLSLAQHLTSSYLLASWSSDDYELLSRALMTLHWLGCDGDTLHLQNIEGMLTNVFDFFFALFVDMSDHEHCHISTASSQCLQ